MRAVFPKVGDSIFFVFLDFTSTCGEQPFSRTKSKTSAYEPGGHFHGKVIGMLVLFFRVYNS